MNNALVVTSVPSVPLDEFQYLVHQFSFLVQLVHTLPHLTLVVSFALRDFTQHLPVFRSHLRDLKFKKLIRSGIFEKYARSLSKVNQNATALILSTITVAKSKTRRTSLCQVPEPVPVPDCATSIPSLDQLELSYVAACAGVALSYKPTTFIAGVRSYEHLLRGETHRNTS